MDVPCVIHSKIDNWKSREWTLEKLSEILGNKEIKFRIGPKEQSTGGILWENCCSYITTSMNNFVSWINRSETSCSSHNPLLHINPETHWCYADYKHMAQMFEDQPEILKAVDWSCFGFDGRDGQHSTMWVGSTGANTPGHFDTYGYNLVAQIFGRKRWFLFPPDQMDCLYPTRIPYEESSVFSEVNIYSPNLEKHPKFQKSTPFVVTLNPGEVLYVPKHWWHFVECLESSLSINSWIEVPSDDKDRFQEALTRGLITGILDGVKILRHQWLNPTEDLVSIDETMQYINESLKVLLGSRNINKEENNFSLNIDAASRKRHLGESDSDETEKNCSGKKILKIEDSRDKDIIIKEHYSFLPENYFNNITKLKPILFNDYLRLIGYHNYANRESIKTDGFTLEKLINCFVHPNVVSVVAEKLSFS